MASGLRRRQWPLVLGIVIAALGGFVAGTWFVFLPYWRSSLEPGGKLRVRAHALTDVYGAAGSTHRLRRWSNFSSLRDQRFDQ